MALSCSPLVPGPRCFPPADILWAYAWAFVAPGGWSASLGISEDGDEYFAICPPGADEAIFLIDYDGARAMCWRPGQPETITCFETLRDAVLHLCPLAPRQIAAQHHAMAVMQDSLGLTAWMETTRAFGRAR